MLLKAPGSTAVAVVSLAVGIAIMTAVFGWIRTVVLNPLPGVRQPDRLVTVETLTASGTMIDSSFPDYRTWRDNASLFEGVIAFKERLVGLGTGPAAERAWAMMVTGNYFQVLGVPAAALR